MSYELPAAPLSIGGVLDSAIRLYRDCMRQCWVLALVYALLMGLFGIIYTLAFDKVAVTGTKDPRQVLATLFSPAAFAGFALAIVAYTVFYGALMKTVIVWAKAGQAISFGAALAASARRLPGLLLGFLLSALIILVGVILLVVPGIYFMGKLQLWMIAMFMDDAGAIDGLGISWRLTRDRWWRGTAIFTVGLILVYVFALALGLVSGFAAALAHLSVTDTAIVNQLFGAASNFVVLPLFVAILVVMYHDFKLRSEGGDLAARMGSLGQT